MAVRKLFGSKPAQTQIKIEIGGASFEATGAADVVERALGSFLEKRTSLPQHPIPMSAEGSTTVRVKRPMRASFIRLHAIDGEIAKIYPLDGRRLKGGMLDRLVPIERIQNIYIEGSVLSSQLKGNQNTLWHLLMSQAVSGVGGTGGKR